MRTFLNISKTTKAAIWFKEKSTEKERGVARNSAIEHDWVEDWFTWLGTLQAVHGRLTSGIPAFENPSQVNQSSTHSSTAFLLARVVQKQKKQLRVRFECLFLAFSYFIRPSLEAVILRITLWG